MSALLQNILLGISLGAPIGPVTIAVVKLGLNNKILNGLYLWLGALAGDATYLLLIHFGLIGFITVPWVKPVIGIIGTLVLLCLGYLSMKEYYNKGEFAEARQKKTAPFFTGYLINISSPWTVVWWLGIYGTAVVDPNNAGLWAGFIILLGALLWFFVLAGLLHFGKRYVTTKTLRYISLVAGLLLIAFGLLAGYHTMLLL